MANNKATTKVVQNCQDRISQLPDLILGRILSSFPTKEGVRTSVLSKRGRYVWSFTPCIEINDHSLLSKNLKSCKTPKLKGSFVDFVRRVLSLNKVSCLQKVNLVCNEDYGGCFSEWIGALTIRDVEEIYLQNLANIGSEQEPRIELPPCLFTCKSLVILKIKHLFVLNVLPKSVCLPSLKILHLVLVQFYDDNSLKNLLAGCPVLEDLNIERDYDEKTKTLHIESSSLKSFRLVIDEAFDEKNLGLVLDANNLERLDLSDHVSEKFIVNSLSSLVSAKLDLHHEYLDIAGAADVYIGLLRKMCNTKYLSLSDLSMQSLSYTTLDNLPKFHNLTHLVVDVDGDTWLVLPYLLECSPNLITFDFIMGESPLDSDDSDEDAFIRDDPNAVGFRTPKCLMLHLESIKIEGFCWSNNEMEMVCYFLKNSTVLKNMAIYVETLKPQQSNLCKKLYMLPKASTACELKIDSYNHSLKKLLRVSQSRQGIVSVKTECVSRKSRKGVKSSN